MAYKIEVRVWKPVDVKASDVLTLTEAAAHLGLSKPAMGDLMRRGCCGVSWTSRSRTR